MLGRQRIKQRYDLFLYRTSADFRRKRSSDRILGDSPAIRRVRAAIQKLSRIPSATVLLTGETGCGKNLAARVIHDSSMPVDAPFVEINCAALPEHLIESELFGYEKGAFTHAVTAKPGLLEEAHEGTLFLDEIGDMPANMQAKLLAVLEGRPFRRLGSTRPIEVNIRVIASTNRDLQADVADKRFREDLFFRLNVVTLALPPLRELGDDILMIAEHFLNVYNVEFKKRVKGFSADARRGLLGHPWPGNVRELANCIERAMIFAEKDHIDAYDLVLSPPARVCRCGGCRSLDGAAQRHRPGRGRTASDRLGPGAERQQQDQGGAPAGAFPRHPALPAGKIPDRLTRIPWPAHRRVISPEFGH